MVSGVTHKALHSVGVNLKAYQLSPSLNHSIWSGLPGFHILCFNFWPCTKCSFDIYWILLTKVFGISPFFLLGPAAVGSLRRAGGCPRQRCRTDRAAAADSCRRTDWQATAYGMYCSFQGAFCSVALRCQKLVVSLCSGEAKAVVFCRAPMECLACGRAPTSRPCGA